MANNGSLDRISKKEDRAILDFILKGNRLYFTGGLNIWKKAAAEGICLGRGHWSLKERFMKTISRNLQSYDLPLETRQKISNFVKASPAEKKRLKIEYGDDEDYLYVHQSLSKKDDNEVSDTEISSDKNKRETSLNKYSLDNHVMEPTKSPAKDKDRRKNDIGKDVESITEKNSIGNQIKTSPKSPVKNTEDRRDRDIEKAKKTIDFEKNPNEQVPEKDNTNKQSNPIITFLDSTAIFQKNLPTAEETRPDKADKEEKKQSQPVKADNVTRPKKNSTFKSKNFKGLPIPERRALRSTLTKLKNL